MPNRILRESIRTSDSINSLNWFEEVLFYRLIVSCDDYGRFDGRPAIIKGTCFPLKDIRVNEIEKALHSLSAAGMVENYTVDGRPFLRLTAWERFQKARAEKSKYPAPGSGTMKTEKNITIEPDCKPLQTSANKCLQVQADVSEYDIRESNTIYEDSARVREKLEEFRDYLEKLEGRPVTTAKMEIVVRKLLSLTQNEEEQIRLLDEAMANGWKNVYRSKAKKSKKPDINRAEEIDYNTLATADFLGGLEDKNEQ